jgi:hypothetical protein
MASQSKIYAGLSSNTARTIKVKTKKPPMVHSSVPEQRRPHAWGSLGVSVKRSQFSEVSSKYYKKLFLWGETIGRFVLRVN